MFGRVALLTGLWIASGVVSAVASPVNPAPQSSTIGYISVGETIQGRLDTTDIKLDDGSHIDCYTLDPPIGQAVQIDMTSSEFDSYLIVADGECGESVDRLDWDDDSGGALNARIVHTFDQDSVHIYTNSATAGETGNYTLSVRLADGSSRSEPSQPVRSSGSGTSQPERTIAVGETRRERLQASDPSLGDGSHYHCYNFAPPTGRSVTISLSSMSFDSYMMVLEGNCSSLGDMIASDDDSGGELDAQISRRFSHRSVAIVVNTVGGNQTGGYELSVR